ncbi:Bax inhibitor-1/YccA family protein [Corynebacterium sp. MSK006]|uniref:Bax inhibitor-1/YccA family protein n=1 Tax=Corynebacterium TaxID=1716 RepID=UPI00254BF3FF|nr:MULTISPECIES: Bax inhibitor-1/YccA family protein [Corynebacterium]MDK8895004.1 Bax inhibitor-1/YccA family protein [Corynebacterium sp. MSK006]
MRSSNPVMRNLGSDFNRNQSAGAYQQGFQNQFDSYGAQAGQDRGYGQPAFGGRQGSERPMTVDDVVTKTGITLGVIVLFALINFGLSLVNPGLALILTGVGGIGGFITVLVHSFGKKFGSAAVTLIYAAFEGLFVGGISLVFAGMFSSQGIDADAGAAIIGQAVLGTIGVFIGMLFVYKTGAIKVTPKFQRIVTGAIVGVAVLALGNLLLALFTGMNPLRDGGMLAIIFSLVCIVLAALSFLQDFDLADELVRAQAPQQMAWGVALGLAVTLVWLYTEILRLLSYFNRN